MKNIYEVWRNFFATYQGGFWGLVGWRIRWLVSITLYKVGEALTRP